MIALVNADPLPVRPSTVAADRRANWDFLAPLQANGTIRFLYPKLGRGAVALFEVDSAETLQGYLTQWSEFVPATFEVTLLVDVDYQKRLLSETE